MDKANTWHRHRADGDQLSEGGSLPTEISKQSSTRQGSADPFGADSTFSGDWALQLKDLSFVKRPDGSDMLLGAGSYGNVRSLPASWPNLNTQHASS